LATFGSERKGRLAYRSFVPVTSMGKQLFAEPMLTWPLPHPSVAP
jgi:hypothetical protein